MSKPRCADVHVLDVVPFGQSDDGRGCFALSLESPGWEDWAPGQFVMVRAPGWGLELSWGRPFSISDEGDGVLRLFFQVVGRGTERLSRLAKGDLVTVWGPLGNGFAVEPDTPTLMLAGGIGIAPFVGYVRRHPRPELLHLVFGHRIPLASYPYDAIAGRALSEHFREKSPADLTAFLATLRERMASYAASAATGGLALACGPLPFLRTVQRYAAELGVRAQLSLENRMACGVGACLGCVSPDANGNRVQVCTHGPVFWSDRIQLTEGG
ncbi:MAG: dihydroorotate dehydrogenase electron transfer subunit [Desulfovibrionaceae bacterium]